MKFNRNKGITLIALVVTIIILLILAGITLSLALNDNGIIKHAKNAKEQQIIATEKEKIALGYRNYLIDKQLSKESENSGEDGDFDLLERYCLGEDKQGKNYSTILDRISYVIKFADIEPIENASNELIVHNMNLIDETEHYITFSYNNNEYKLIIEDDENTKRLEKVTTSNELIVDGATVEGNENKGWTITFTETEHVYKLSIDGEIEETQKNGLTGERAKALGKIGSEICKNLNMNFYGARESIINSRMIPVYERFKENLLRADDYQAQAIGDLGVETIDSIGDGVEVSDLALDIAEIVMSDISNTTGEKAIALGKIGCSMCERAQYMSPSEYDSICSTYNKVKTAIINSNDNQAKAIGNLGSRNRICICHFI